MRVLVLESPFSKKSRPKRPIPLSSRDIYLVELTSVLLALYLSVATDTNGLLSFRGSLLQTACPLITAFTCRIEVCWIKVSWDLATIGVEQLTFLSENSCPNASARLFVCSWDHTMQGASSPVRKSPSNRLAEPHLLSHMATLPTCHFHRT